MWLTVAIPTSVTAIQKPARVRRWVRTQRVRVGIIIESLLASLKRLLSEDSLAIVLVEQHAKLALQVTREALVMSRGRVIHHGPSRELLADPERLARLVVAQ